MAKGRSIWERGGPLPLRSVPCGAAKGKYCTEDLSFGAAGDFGAGARVR